ncbi:MAG: DUF4082 domain-containing protein [Verrucomicrobia bacterium]|nr:DUF4082 domain-containing protein [Verrucomicrobiota bacterium]
MPGDTARPRQLLPDRSPAHRWSATLCVAVSLLLAAAWAMGAQAAQTVTLAWDPNPASGIVGYRIHYGIASGVYTHTSDAGSRLTATISGLTNGRTYFFAVTAYNREGLESSPSSEIVYTAGAVSLFKPGAAPSIITVNDSHPVELGVKFQSLTAGKVIAIRFYKGPENTGSHTAHLWSASGSVLARAVFSGESASGWQQVDLPRPVPILANTTYVASYHTDSGHYSADGSYFTIARKNGSLLACADRTSGGNGVYTYGVTSSFPKDTYNASNYWVDVVVTTDSFPVERTRRLKGN